MKAAVLRFITEPLVIDDLTIPKLKVGQVLVKIHIAGICGKQIAEINGWAGVDNYLPHLLGHEGAGVVMDAGPGVVHVKPDDRVVMHWRKGVGIEAEPARYKAKKLGVVGAGRVTTFSEYAVVSENRVTKIPDNVPFEHATLLGCATTTGLGLVNNEAELKIGQSIVVAGCGGVGLAVIQGARMVSAYPIVAIDRYPDRVGAAKRLGATTCLTANGIDWTETVGTVDVFVDCTGNPEVIDAGFQATAPGGRMILVGQPPHEEILTFWNARQHYCGKTLLDSQGGLTNPTMDIPRYVRLYSAGLLKLDMPVRFFSLQEANEAIQAATKGEATRCMIVMN